MKKPRRRDKYSSRFSSRRSDPHFLSQRNVSLEIVREALIEPFRECQGTWDQPMTDIDRLLLAFGDGQREIHRRRVLSPIKVTGLWWMEPLKVLGTKTVRGGTDKRWPGGFCLYVREDFREKTVDIEAQVQVKIQGKATSQWLSCTLDEAEYEKLEQVLGPREEPCKVKSHKRISNDQ